MTERTKEQDLWHKRGFAAGIAVACATMVDVWGEEVAPEEIMAGAGLTTRAKMKALGVDDYDLDILKPVFATLRARKPKRRRLSTKEVKALGGAPMNVFEAANAPPRKFEPR